MQRLSDWYAGLHIIGLGGTGTHVLQSVLELGAASVTLWDHDTVEAHNLPTQFLYSPEDVGNYKVDAARRFVVDRGFTTKVTANAEKVVADTQLDGFVISGVDTMDSRQAIWNSVKYDGAVRLYMDFRIGGDVVQLHCVDPNDDSDIERYEDWLLPEESVPDLGCVTRANPHSALATAVMTSTILTLLMEGKPIRKFVERHLLSEHQNGRLPSTVTT